MATNDIDKLAVYDPRIVQKKPVYAVEQGALSITNANFNALSETASQQNYNISVPSENVFVDRGIEWTSTCSIDFSVDVANSALHAGEPVVQLGRHASLAPFPLHQLTTTVQATVNDTQVNINTDQVLNEVLRFVDFRRNRGQRTCPTKLDTFANNADAYGKLRNAGAGVGDANDQDEVSNGAWQNIQFVQPTGAPNPGQLLTGNGSYISGGITVNQVNGRPIVDAGVPSYPLAIRFTTTENLVLSPFIFSDVKEYETGLYGLQNIQVLFNMRSPSSARVLRFTPVEERTLSVAPSYQATAFQNSRLSVQFLTPSLNISLPAKSVVPYTEFPQYLSRDSTNLANGATHSYQSQTLTLNQIPDLLVLYVKAQTLDATQGDQYASIESMSLQFDNFSGLLSSMTQSELYRMSVKNGLNLDFNQWVGVAKSAGIDEAGLYEDDIPLTGSILILKPGVDFPLQTGQAPGLLGNYTLQYTLNCRNRTGTQQVFDVRTITINSGFFESMSGSSRVIRGVLSEQDIINAPMSGASRGELRRLVGNGVGDMLGHAVGKISHLQQKAKPVAKVVKEVARASGTQRGKKVAKALERMGMGMDGRLM